MIPVKRIINVSIEFKFKVVIYLYRSLIGLDGNTPIQHYSLVKTIAFCTSLNVQNYPSNYVGITLLYSAMHLKRIYFTIIMSLERSSVTFEEMSIYNRCWHITTGNDT